MKENTTNSISQNVEADDLKFACPVCGCANFRLVEDRITAYIPILSVSTEGQITWGDDAYHYNEDLSHSWYECARGDYRLENDGDPISGDTNELIEWLEKHHQRKTESE